MRIPQETAHDLGLIKDLTDQDVIQMICDEYQTESDLYLIETEEGVKLGVDSEVYHMESGIILDWFDSDQILIDSAEYLNAPRITWRDRNGDREEI